MGEQHVPAPRADELTGRPVRKSTGRPVQKVLSAVVGAAVVVGAVLATTAGATRAPESVDRPGDRAVRTAPVEAAPALRTHRFFGVSRAARRADLAFQAGGRLVDRAVDVGDRVEAGARLARLDAAPLEHATQAASARIARLDAELAQARRDARRVERLGSRDAATGQAVEQARAGVAALGAARREAAAGLAEARRQRAEADLVAPFAGTVTAVHAEPGELVGAGRPIVSLVGEDGLEVALEVPETVVADLRNGAPVDVFFPLLDQRVVAHVSQIGGEAAGPGRLFPVVLSLPTGHLRAGLTAEATLATPRAPALAVPLAAVVDPAGGRPRVFRVTDGVAHRVPVVVGELADGGRVVLTASGGEAQPPLQAADAVVIGGHFALLDGDAVVEVPR